MQGKQMSFIHDASATTNNLAVEDHRTNLRIVSTDIWVILAAVVLVLCAWAGSHHPVSAIPWRVTTYGVQPALWIFPALLLMMHFRDSLRQNRFALNLVLIALTIGVCQITISFFFGTLVGFGRSPYTHGAVALLSHAWYVAAILVARELTRWGIVVALNERMREGFAIAATWLLFFVTSLSVGSYAQFTNADHAFQFVGGSLMPAAAISLLATYLAFAGGPVASISYLGVMAMFEWLSPILPNLTWPVAAMVGVLVPMLGLSAVEHAQAAELQAEDASEGGVGWTWIIAAIALVVVVWFDAGVFGVQPSLVQGHSMEPKFHTGDLVLTQPVNATDLKIGDIIRFDQGSHEVMHRIVEIQNQDGELAFVTKGDNNSTIDGAVTADKVRGRLVTHIADVGKPGIYLKKLVTHATQ